ncbi:MAG: permease-like cell division protein FtsX [Woeseiaceae bacterium]|nr:permease-like cell division protein FtsX [Woeseiaceae bacterium]
MSRHSEAVAPVRKSGPLSVWATRHANNAVGALGRLVRQPFASLMIVLVIAVTLALPAALNLLVKNARAISGGWESALDFSVFLDMGVAENSAQALATLLQQRADVESAELVTADEAMREFKASSGFGAALDQLPENPLPHAIVVRPSAANTSETIGLLQADIASLPEVEFVQSDTAWVQRFHAILDVVRQAVVIAGFLLGAAIIVIIGNTIRLDIENRREEIEVTKLIGASNAFVRRPFLWSGFWFGLLGGLLALALLQAGLVVLDDPIARLAGLYHGGAAMLTLGLDETGIIVGAGVGLGLLGSWFAVSRHMRRIEPR